jgi:chromosome partitioning protein
MELKTPRFKIRQAIELSGTALDASTFKQLAGKAQRQEGDPYHTLFTPLDIRQARLRLIEQDLSGEPLHKGIPPLCPVRMAKGGVGKTTVCGNVGYALACMGYRVLLIDGDPQASLSNMFGIDAMTEEILHIGNLIESFSTNRTANWVEAIRPIFSDCMLDIIPADITMSDVDGRLLMKMNREDLFSRLLAASVETLRKYDCILVDSAPGVTLLALNFMIASQKILTPVWLDGHSIKAMEGLQNNISEINISKNINLDFEIVANGFHGSVKHCKDYLKHLVETYGSRVNDVIIPHYVGFGRQMKAGDSSTSGPSGVLMELEPGSVGSRAITDLARSMARKWAIRISDTE